MNAKIIQALREFESELSAICYEYFCKDALTTAEYQNKKDGALRRCKIKIEIAIEDKDDEKQSQFLKDWNWNKQYEQEKKQ